MEFWRDRSAKLPGLGSRAVLPERQTGKEGRGGKILHVCLVFINSRPRGQNQVLIKHSGVFRESVPLARDSFCYVGMEEK